MHFSDSSEAWASAVAHLRRKSPGTFDQWFAGVQFDAFEDGLLRLTARDEFVRDWVREHFVPELTREFTRLLSREEPVRVAFAVSSLLTSPIAGSRGQTPSGTTASSNGPASGAPNSVTGSPTTPATPPNALHAPGVHSGAATSAAAKLELGSEAAFSKAQHAPPPAPLPYVDDPRDTRRFIAARPSTPPSSPQSSRSRAVISTQLNPKYTFSNFVVGPANNLAYAAAFASAGGTGKRYNPLFIAGGTGLGKTHLMHAIAHKLLDENPHARVVYVSAEHFTNEFIEALQNHRMDEFRSRYRGGCDLLLLDDVQFLAGREQTQEEFFHTFNALHDADKPIVVTSDKYPQDLQRMPERLVSRFNSGLVADVHLPQLETRVAIVKKKAEIEGILLLDEVAVMLASAIQSNVRELEGALIRLAAKSSLVGRPIDAEFASSELAMVAPRRAPQVSVQDIQKAVCGHFSLSNSDLLSKDRHKSVAFARQVAMYLCRQRLKCSFPELGKAFGNRDHTTIMSAVKRVEKLRQEDPQVNAHLEAIEQRLASSDE